VLKSDGRRRNPQFGSRSVSKKLSLQQFSKGERLSKIKQRIEQFFLQPKSQPGTSAVAANAMLAFISAAQRAVPTAVRPRFSAFTFEHVAKAAEISARLMSAQPKGNQTRMEAALDLAELLRPSEELSGLVDHALQVFITNDAEGRAFVDAVPSPLERLAAAKTTGDFELENGAALPSPDGLEWLREDPFLNEHHEHWHVVYPTQGVRDATGVAKPKDRQGELFLYMHQQMIARYEVELDAMGLAGSEVERLEPYDDFGQPIPIGYQPGPDLLFNETTNPNGYGSRPAGLASPETLSGGLSRQDLADRRQRFSDAIIKRQWSLLEPPTAVTMDNLGATLEPNLATVSNTFYASYHGSGHNFISQIGSSVGGVMGDTAAAIRDPVFWRWHKHIDNLGLRFSNRFPSQDFSDAPYVSIRTRYLRGESESPDILLYETSKTWQGPNCVVGDPTEVLTPGLQPTATLHTSLARRSLTMRTGSRVRFDKLEHTEFAFAIRVQNQMPRQQTVTVRVFLAPVVDKSNAERTEDRYAWIELDKFLCDLPSLASKWVVRHGSDSSVVRKPAWMSALAVSGLSYRLDPEAKEEFDKLAPSDPGRVLFEKLLTIHGKTVYESAESFRSQLEGTFPGGRSAFQEALVDGFVRDLFSAASIDEAKDFPDVTESYCRCGWPYHLLLPRGLPDAGMRFRLFVVLTDWDEDRVGPTGCCGSASFCGAIDRYPDKRPMGYPFDRPWPGAIRDVVPSRRNMAFRDFRIVHEDLRNG
jgi:hypothetical protein